MSTLGTLKQEIADDLARSDLTSQIATAIARAIKHYQSSRFYFNETRDVTFDTVAAQTEYGVADDADIPLIQKIDGVFATVNSDARRLSPIAPVVMEQLLDAQATEGEPLGYCWFNQGFRIYPKPDAVYPIRVTGHIAVAAPSGDDTAGNVWMTEAYELIHCRAKKYLFGHVLRDTEGAVLMQAGEDAALAELEMKTGKKIATGDIVPTSF